MFPLLANSFGGYELTVFLPLLGAFTLFGFVSVLTRTHLVALVCGVGCILLGVLLSLAGIAQSGQVRLIEITYGVIAIAVGALLCVYRRKAKR